MTTNEFLTLIALVMGPVSAVLIQLSAEHRKVVRERQIDTMRMLVGARHLPGDPRWTQAINMVPLDFNKQKNIMAAWREYNRVIKYAPTDENRMQHEKEVLSKQIHLIAQVMQHLKYDLPETELQDSAYAAGGMITRDNLMINGWASWPRIASALEAMNLLSLKIKRDETDV